MISFPLHCPRLSEPDRQLAASPPPHGRHVVGGISPDAAQLWPFPCLLATFPIPQTDGDVHLVGRRRLFERNKWFNPGELKVN